MFLPDDSLKEWIKQFWILEGKGNGNNLLPKQILPDGCATLAIVLNGEFDLGMFESGKLQRGIYIVPPVVRPHFDMIRDDIFLIDIHLNPGVFYKLFKIPIKEFETKVYTCDELSLKFDNIILDRLEEIKEDKNLLYKELNSFCKNLFYKKSFYSEDIVLSLQELYRTGDLDSFFKSQKLSIRQLERNVKKYTGLTPKNISKLGRFYNVLEQIKFKQFDINFTELAFENKFADQSHLIREFKSFSDISPGQFIKDINNFPQYVGLCNLTKITEI